MESPEAIKNGASTKVHHLLFDDFEIDAANRILLCRGEPVPLTGKVFDILLVFAENPGRLLEKDELIEKVWGDQFVEEGNLARNVSTLRRALGDTDKNHKYIATVQGRGYRFLADVSKGLRTFSPTPEYSKYSDGAPPPLRSESVVGRYGLFIGAGVVIIALFVVSWYRWPQSGSPASTRPLPLAVLPFQNKGGESLDYLADGLTEKIIDDLSALAGLKVKSKNSVFRLKGREYDASALASELGVRMLLIGKMEQRDDRYAFDVELTDASDNSQIWGQRFVGSQAEIAAIQNSIVMGVVKAAGIELTDVENARLSGRQTTDPAAYRSYLLGRFFWNKRTGADLKKAAAYYQQALDADPKFASAYSGLANCYALYSVYDVEPPTEAFPKAKVAAMRALEIDPFLAEAHTSLAYVLYHFEWDWQKAEAEFRRAIELDSNYPTAHHWYGEFLGAVGRFDEAVREQQTALELDPLSFIINMDLGWNYYLSQNYDKAIEQYKKALDLDPNSPITHYTLSETLEHQSKYRESADEYFAALAREGFTEAEIQPLKSALTRDGYNGFVRSRIDWRQKVFTRRVQPQSLEVAADHVRLGENDKALASLNEALEKRESDVVFLKFNPTFSRLRDDQRFQGLLAKIGLK